MMSALKDIRFVALLILVVSAAVIISSPAFLKSGAPTVATIDEESRCALKEGDVINQVFSALITDQQTFDKAMRNVKAGDRVTMVVNGLPFGCEAVEDRSLGVILREEKPQSLRFGIDIEGGTRVVLSPTQEATREEIRETVKTLENRINFYGLKEVKVTELGSNLIQIEMAGATGDEVRDFISKQGVFEGRLLAFSRISGGEGSLKVGNDTHSFVVDEKSIEVGGEIYSGNDTFDIGDDEVQIVSITNNTVTYFIHVFDGEDIINVLSDSQNSQIGQVAGGSYQFNFGVQLSRESAEKFARLTSGYPAVVVSGGERYIEPKLVLFLDEKVITDLNIASSIAGQAITTPSISGGEDTLDAARKEKLRIESTLRSGSLPIKLEIVKVDTITQTSGKDLINSTVFVALASVLAVAVIVTYRYRDWKIALPMVIISLLEIVIVLGMAGNQIFAGVVIALAFVIGVWKREVMGWIGWITLVVMIFVAGTVAMSPWTIDIPAIAGLIAILGTSINQMIIMTDQLFREKDKHLSERHRIAMQMIWSSAATVVFAMIPLLLGGIGTLKGFAIATIIGVLVGILITRPAYMAIVERAKKIQLEGA